MQVSPVPNFVGTSAWTGLFEAFDDSFAGLAFRRFLRIASFIKREDNWR
jgi:hypothetical protein